MDWVIIKRVKLQPHHLNPGRTRHTLRDGNEATPFPPFTSLEIAQYPGDQGYYLLHICDEHLSTDTWHETLEDALHQAEWEFEVRPEEWTDVNAPS